MDFLSKKAILTDIKSTRKEDVIKEMVDLLIGGGDVEKRNRNKLIGRLWPASLWAQPRSARALPYRMPNAIA
jgi:hypothetical protein